MTDTITEYADFVVRAEDQPAFLAAVGEAVALFRQAEGCRAMRLTRLVERPDTFRLVVRWRDLEAHTQGFQKSEGFQKWRALVGGYFAATPVVEHAETVVAGF